MLKVNVHTFGLTKYTVKNVPFLVPVFLYAVTCTMLIFQIKRIISSEKWFKYDATFVCFQKMPKIWVGQTTLNREKKDDGLKNEKKKIALS